MVAMETRLSPRTRRPGTVTAAVVLLGIQSGLGALAGIALLLAATRHPGRGFAVVAVLSLALDVAVIVLMHRDARRGLDDLPAPPRPAPPRDDQSGADVTPGGLTPGGLLLGGVTLALFLGALAIRSDLVFGIVVVAAIFVPIEKLFQLHPQKTFREGWRTDLVHFVVNNLFSLVGIVLGVVAFGLALHALVPDSVRSSIAAQPALVQFAAALAIVELCQYWAHRATHTVPLLWRFHKVHHSIEQMDWLAAARLHPIDQAFTRSCVIIPLFALGFSKATLGAYLVVTTFQALFIHANTRLTFGPLRQAIATPEFHHWHHAAAPTDRNFAGQLPLVDRLFGTLHLPKHEWPTTYGIGEPPPAGYLRQLAWPFRHQQG